jgi:hypothetical protein
MFDRYSANPLGDGFWKLGNNGHKSMTLTGAGHRYHDPHHKTKVAPESWKGRGRIAGVGLPDIALAWNVVSVGHIVAPTACDF